MDPSSSSSSSMVSFPSSNKRQRDPNSYDEPRPKRPKNDVFLNYSVEDCGKSFVSHLKGALTRNGFNISDHTKLPTGQDVNSELLKAIDESHTYLVVFSANYALSTDSLDELALIMDRHNCLPKFNKKGKVFPVFFKIDPSDVKNQQGCFKDAFQAHNTKVDQERVHKWRQALKDVAHLAGQTLQYGDEEKFVRKIVKQLREMQNPQELCDTERLVGIEPRVHDIISALRLSDQVFSIVAVLGISGSGKTTIVKAAYDKIAADFDISCFIADINNYEDRDRNWKVDLQQDVISYLSGNNKLLTISIRNRGVEMIKKLITGRKVLLVLDDVYTFEQLQALGVPYASFDCRSRIIVTTRNKHSLSNLPYTPYDIPLLDNRESIELFTRLTFGKDDPGDNKKFVEEVVCCAAGLPLVLEVWSHHFNCHKREQWPSILETLKRIPHEDIQKKLQLSFDSLTKRAKNLFLDIACFFVGMDKDLVVKVLQDEDSGFDIEIEIQNLVDKCLVKISYDDSLSLHDVIREMGKEVVRQENEDEPGQRTRLMDPRDIIRVLTDCSGTDSIKSIIADYYMFERPIVKVEAFKKMSNLRFIRLVEDRLQWSSSSSNDDMSPTCFKHLKYLEWKRFPFKSINNIDMGNVVVIELRHSKLETLWEGVKSLKKLRILDVSFSRSLAKTGNFTGLEKLEKLCLKVCENLEEIDSSIGCLEKLVSLDLSYCTRLESFQSEKIGKLTSLVELNLNYCPNILKISHEVGTLKSLKYLGLCQHGFPQLPDSICQLHELSEIKLSGCLNLKSIPNLPTNIKSVKADGCRSLENLPSNMSELQFLQELDLNGCYNLEPEGFMKVTGLRNLRDLRMRNCNVSQVSSEIGNLESLRHLDLSANPFCSLPDSFSNLSQLVDLYINDCSKLQLLPLLSSNLQSIDASRCRSLDVMPFDSKQRAYIFRYKLCQESFFTGKLRICLSGEELPDWCNYTSSEEVLSFVAPMHLDNKIYGVILCAAALRLGFDLKMLNKTKETDHLFKSMGYIGSNMLIMMYPLNDTTLVVEAGDAVEIQFNAEDLSLGLSWIYESDVVDSKLVIQPTFDVRSEVTAMMRFAPYPSKTMKTSHLYYNCFPQ